MKLSLKCVQGSLVGQKIEPKISLAILSELLNMSKDIVGMDHWAILFRRHHHH